MEKFKGSRVKGEARKSVRRKGREKVKGRERRGEREGKQRSQRWFIKVVIEEDMRRGGKKLTNKLMVKTQKAQFSPGWGCSCPRPS